MELGNRKLRRHETVFLPENAYYKALFQFIRFKEASFVLIRTSIEVDGLEDCTVLNDI